MNTTTPKKLSVIPGPIGLWTEFTSKKAQEGKDITISQMCKESANDYWLINTWEAMEVEYAQDIIKHNINTVKIQTKISGSNKKYPFLAALVIDDDYAAMPTNVILSLKDKTGEIKAIISKDLYAENTNHLVRNSVILLRNFSVLPVMKNTVMNSYYIIIGSYNLEAIYSACIKEVQCKIIIKTQEEINSNEKQSLKSIDNFESDDNWEHVFEKIEELFNKQDNFSKDASPCNINKTVPSNSSNNQIPQNSSCSPEKACSVSTKIQVPDLDLGLDLDEFSSLDNVWSSEVPVKKFKPNSGKDTII